MAQPAASHDGRTLVAAVMFADLVGYSKKPVTDQLAVKNAFRDLMQAAIAPLEAGSRILVDTGDGAAIAFLRDPEHALYAALRVADAVRSGNAARGLRAQDLRIGINLGPVRRAMDVNGRPNLVGDGINAAERVMSFAAPGDATSSRSFRDAVACLHESYAQLFEPLGSRADKHGREHEVFRIGHSADALAASTTSLAPQAPGRVRARVDARFVRRGAALGAVTVAVVAALYAAWPSRHGAVDPARSPAMPAPNSVSPTMAAPPPPAAPVQEAVSDVRSVVQTAAQRPPEAEVSAAPSVPQAARRSAPPARRREGGGPPSASCAGLTQKATVGELTAGEQRLLQESCR